MNNLIKCGITGGIGSGKSYISNIFNTKYNIPIYNSDFRAKNIMINDNDIIREIINNFGEDSYIDGKINKEKFNNILFNDKEKLLLMNSIIIPRIEKDFDEFCNSLESPYILKESAILYETNTYKNLDKIICVISHIEKRIDRVTKRDNITKELFLKKHFKQASDNDRIKISDYTICNNGDKLIEQIDDIHNSLINFSKLKNNI
jgi:dephospho-CoA kinase